MDRKIPVSLLWRSFLLLALVLSACITPTPTPQGETPTSPATIAPSEMPSPQATPLLPQPVVDNPNFGLVCERNKQIDFRQVLETTSFFIKGQVILTGPAETLKGNLEALAAAGVDLTPVILCTLGIPEQMPNPNPGKEPFQKKPLGDGLNASFPFANQDKSQPRVEGNRLVMNLYQFDDKQITLIKIIQQLNDLQKNLPAQARVYADPNYLTGHMANTACGSPFGVEGSPFGVEGSPFGVEGSPYGGMGLNADPAGFWNQWAFQRVGLTPPGERNFKETGEGVRVGVFDTSPYKVALEDPPTLFTDRNINPELDLTVHYPNELSNLKITTPITAQVDVQDHGLFVSSLIHAFAYESQIHLYRVLDDAGCGDLYRLNIAMLDFLSVGWGEQGLKQPSVINLSLGVRKPAVLPTRQPASVTAGEEISQMEMEIQEAYELVEVNPSTVSLETVVQLAHQAGIVIVAAAGNDSVLNDPPVRTPPLLNMPLPADLPADYPFAIGVSASMMTNGPACYSNLGDVAAPGGEAKEDVDSNGDAICVSHASDCPVIAAGNPGSCEFGVIGLSTLSLNSHYAYWTGTSFATPMVSGLAALVYQRLGVPGDTARRVTTQVSTIPDNRYGNGLINVQAALQP